MSALTSVRARLVALVSIGLLGCASASTQRAFIAPTSETITSITEESNGPPLAHVIYIANRSTVPVLVFSVSLSGCENVKQRCGATPTKLKVPPGSRSQALRIERSNPERGFEYRFGFSWHADSSGVKALAALAEAGDAKSQAQLAAMKSADANRKRGINELSRDDFQALSARIAHVRGEPDSLMLAPGEQTTVDKFWLVLLDEQRQVLGYTHAYRFGASAQNVVRFTPPGTLTARAPGRVTYRFELSETVQSLLAKPLDAVEIPVIVAYPADPHAPSITGRALDADSKAPLACARVALEDSAQNVVVHDRTGVTGAFSLQAPRPGTYRVRVETRGWAPSYGPMQVLRPDEDSQNEYLIRFTDQMLAVRQTDTDLEHAYPAAVSMMPTSGTRAKSAKSPVTPTIQGVTIGGSPSMPILGILSKVAPQTVWMQFVVDSTGNVDINSLMLPPGTAEDAKAGIATVLPRVRFSPARESGKPTCELQRMQVNFSAR